MIWARFQHLDECDLLHLIAAYTSRPQRTCDVIYFEGFYPESTIFSACCLLILVCEANKAATLLFVVVAGNTKEKEK